MIKRFLVIGRVIPALSSRISSELRGRQAVSQAASAALEPWVTEERAEDYDGALKIFEQGTRTEPGSTKSAGEFEADQEGRLPVLGACIEPESVDPYDRPHRSSLIPSLIHVRVPRSIGGYHLAPSRHKDQHGQSWIVILNPEKRKVGGSTPPLTTHSEPGRIFGCGGTDYCCEMEELRMRPMTGAEFEAFRAKMIPGYAADKVRAGDWDPDQAETLATQSMDELLPAGPDTPKMFLRCAETAAGEPVGLVWTALDRPRPGDAWIYYIEINPAHRGAGYGHALLQAAEQEAGQHGARAVGLNVLGANTIARGLYESSGYQVASLTMSKDLSNSRSHH